MKPSTQIKPISHLKAHAAEIVRRLSEEREPLIITQNGEAKVVMQDVRSFEENQETLSPEDPVQAEAANRAFVSSRFLTLAQECKARPHRPALTKTRYPAGSRIYDFKEHPMHHSHRFGLMPFIAALLLLGLTAQLRAAEPSAKDAQALIDGSVRTLGKFLDDKAQDNFRDKLKEAKSVVIMPRHVAAGLIVGGAGGKCTVLARYDESNKWSQPWFCSVAAGSVGLQIGAGVSEVIILVMTNKGMEAVKKSQTILGQDASTADGSSPESQGDTLVFARKTEGAFAGSPLTGSVLSPADGLNKAYYGKVVTARDVFERKEVYNRDASKLVSIVSRNAKVRKRR